MGSSLAANVLSIRSTTLLASAVALDAVQHHAVPLARSADHDRGLTDLLAGARMKRQFDALVHLDATRALAPLDHPRDVAGAAGEPPETYPSGV